MPCSDPTSGTPRLSSYVCLAGSILPEVCAADDAIATHGFGLLKLDRAVGRLIRYDNVAGDLDSLPQRRIDAMFEDREGNIWVAPGDLGPAYFPSEPPPFKKLLKGPGSIIGSFVGALYEDRQRTLWIGTPEALNSVDPKTGRVTSCRPVGSAIGADVISLSEDRSSNLWVGPYSHGLHCFDPRTGKFKTYRHNQSDPNSLSDDFVGVCLSTTMGCCGRARA